MTRLFKIAFWLCVLLLNEFGPANLALLSDGKYIGQPTVHDDGHHHEEKDIVIKKAEEKSGIAVAAKLAYKVFKIGAKVIPKMITLASFSNAIFRAISGCCLDFPEACKGHDKIIKLQEQIRKKSMDIDALQLEARNLQVWTESGRNKFSLLVTEMARTIDDTDILVRSLSPQVITAINNKTVTIKKLVREKNKIGEKVDLDTVESMYGDALGSFLDITLPLFELILPSLPKIVKFAADKFIFRQAQKLNNILEKGLKSPPANSVKAIGANGWFAKTKAKIDNQINSIQLKINAKYSNAVKILNKVGKGLNVLLNAVISGYEVYNIIDSAITCKAKRDNVLKSLRELESASKELDRIYNEVKKSKMAVEQAWMTLYQQVSSEALTRDLREIQTMLSAVSGSVPDVEYMSSRIGVYITNIADAREFTAPEDIYHLLDDLTTVMGKVPFAIECFNNKVLMLNFIWEGCRTGADTFNNLYQEGIELFDERAKLCQGKIGILYLDRANIKKSLSQMARRLNFNEDCILNSKLKKQFVCQLKESGYPLEEIGERAKLTKSQVEFLTNHCPKHEITPSLRKAICNLRKLGLSDEKAANALKLDVTGVHSVKC